MFKNYLKTAGRNLLKKSSFSIINILGLTTGITAALILFIVVKDELSYDKDQKNFNHIYRVVSQDQFSDDITYNSGVPVPALDALRLTFPQITFGAIRSIVNSQVTVNTSQGQNKYVETQGIYFAEPSLFAIINKKWIAGSEKVLAEPNTVVLSKTIAAKYFGRWQNATGKTVRLDNRVDLRVSGIVEADPFNTDFPMGVVVSYQTLKSNIDKYPGYQTNWGSTSSAFQVLALLPPSVNPKAINKQLQSFVKEHYLPNPVSKKSHWLQPLSAFHFDKRFEGFGTHIIEHSTVYTLSLIAVFILLMASINFINLSTAQAVTRSKEMGMRKVLGSNRIQLIFQVLGETLLLVVCAMILAAILTAVVLPMLRHLINLEGTTGIFTINILGPLLIMGILVTFFSGIYPALVMSRFKPITALRTKMSTGKMSMVSVRSALVIIQFALSQILILGTLVAVSQMNFLRKADVGFDKDVVLVLQISTDSSSISGMEAFRHELQKTDGVASVSFANDVPLSDNLWTSNFAYNHLPTEQFQVSEKFVDTAYLNTFGLKLIAGQNITASDTAREALVNETLLRMIHVKKPEDAIGKPIRIGGGNWLTLAGVVKDFHSESLKNEIKPMIIISQKKNYAVTAVKMRATGLKNTMQSVEGVWNEFYPEYAYNASFLDERIGKLYQQDEQLATLYKIFSILAICIAGLGLYGLVSFMAVQKFKEVGIRKVLGASVKSIVFLFSKEFSVLVLISFLIAIPVSWYAMQHWLNNFAFRIKMGPGYFILALAITLVIAWLAVGYKSIHAALSSPVKSLRTE